MGEVKRWEFDVEKARDVEDSEGRYVLHSDYARLERERDELAEIRDGLVDELQATEDELEGCMEELTRLRAVEAAAKHAIEQSTIGRATDGEKYIMVSLDDMRALAEACGRKG